MSDELIARIRARVAQCRGLAASITDERARATLLHMADEGDADIVRLEADQGSGEPPTGDV